MTIYHHRFCGWHLDQYSWECTCGVSQPKHPEFDQYVRDCLEHHRTNRLSFNLDTAPRRDTTNLSTE